MDQKKHKKKEDSKKRSVRHLDTDSDTDSDVSYEDPYADEYDENEEVIRDDEIDDSETLIKKFGTELKIEDEEEEKDESVPYIPNKNKIKDEEEEELEFSNTAYAMFHRLNTEWPCLTMDVLRDDLGYNRTKFPMSCTFVAGTQAETRDDNKIYIFNVTGLHRTEYDSDSEKEEEQLDDLDDDAVVKARIIKTSSEINRIKAMPQKSSIIASWLAEGKVNIYDISNHLKLIKQDLTNLVRTKDTDKPLCVGYHSTEGFALNWSPVKSGLLASGDCNGNILLWNPHQGGKWTIGDPLSSHKGSVEDICFSPKEDTVFASCSSDKTVHIWDTRKKKSAMQYKAGESDINVIAWNPQVTNLLASGDDDGILRVWDLRTVGKKNHEAIAEFKFHQDQITSVDWNPNDSSVVACSSADDSTTVWDLSVESEDTDEKYEVPPQLMFLHMGQQDVKEVHWHPQISDVLLTTSATNINIFKPSNFHEEEKTMDEEITDEIKN